MTRSQVWLSRFAKLSVVATFALIFLGALVTSKNAGLAVPDWPLSFGSLNPPGWWEMELVRLEHSHRLVGALIGVLTITLAVWTWRAESRRWVRWLAVAAVAGVCVQGIMGGLRVTQLSTALAVVHGCIAQLFLSAMIVLATALSPVAKNGYALSSNIRNTRVASLILVSAVFLQLIAGAIMRHYKAGLAIPDFPLAFGRVIPPLTDFYVTIHFAHRVGAVVVVATVLWVVALILRTAYGERHLLYPAMWLLCLVGTQVGLGAAVIWSVRGPLPTTLHVVNGAGVLGISVLILTRTFLMQRSRTESEISFAQLSEVAT
jgi:heme a synthase